MADKNKNFWLKLQKDFFKRHDVKIIEAMPNGIEIAYLYIKLLAESITHDGRLRFSETVPYTNKMLSAVLCTDEEIVNQAIDIFISLNLVEILEDQTIYMTELQNMVGCETKDAERMRRMRNRNNVTDNRNNVQNCYTEKEKEKEKESDSSVAQKKSFSESKSKHEPSFDIELAKAKSRDTTRDFGKIKRQRHQKQKLTEATDESKEYCPF